MDGATPLPAPTILGVERSFTGRRWRSRLADDRPAYALADRFGLPEVVARVLTARGVGPDEAERFLAPTLRDHLPDPSHLLGMDVAADRLAAAIRSGEAIAIFGDYDVDGATSSALLVRFLRAAGGRVRAYIPDRMTEGYGPNTPALLRLRQEGAGVVVTVDCGTTAFAPLAAARQAGLDVIVIDHHVAEPALPDAVAVVNPNRLDQVSQHRGLAAVGVCFLLAVALNRTLRAAGWWRDRPEPDLLSLLDLVALGTVCDVMPLTGLNRALVAQGLKVMARRANVGIAALADVARLDQKPQAFHLGYLLGPRVNAGGRVGRADLGTRLLSTEDPAEAAAIAVELDRFNEERRRIEGEVLVAAMAMVEQGGMPAVLTVGDAGWHPGVIGIVASRLKDRFNRPAMVLAVADGIAKGSGRSIPGFDLGAAVIAARQAGILTQGGGHAMAAGFTLPAGAIPEFGAFLCDRFGACGIATGRVAELGVDGSLALSALDTALVARLDGLGPFGAGMSEPRFALAHVKVVRADLAGQNHVRLILGSAAGERVKGIAFRAMDSELGPSLIAARGRTVHVAGHLSIDNWNGGDTVQIRIDDAAPAA
ncbi:exonuclease RecJ [Stella humosa]|uniref:Single-stranded-DNA-specific exonuclease RecJ n=1 Tax=Stella humosa TaxID=94 RepID=A0A3N1MDD7_9PROT|nr:single-stranded-DNA-specific exonuclease RecJ [Stella humosa]ROQ01741.1 exonuclease RecJ [Stella humosa]BBK32124.1 single-stranded-DNA-specific exonuclease RecJ [Stella humosa]